MGFIVVMECYVSISQIGSDGKKNVSASIPLKFISLRATLCTEPVLGQVIVETTKK